MSRPLGFRRDRDLPLLVTRRGRSLLIVSSIAIKRGPLRNEERIEWRRGSIWEEVKRSSTRREVIGDGRCEEGVSGVFSGGGGVVEADDVYGGCEVIEIGERDAMVG